MSYCSTFAYQEYSILKNYFMSIKSQIPNSITLLNLFSGCIAVVYAAEAQYEQAFFFVALGIFFDFFDGFFARLFHVQSELGLQLDSLADMVTSGVTPGLVMYQFLRSLPMEGALAPYLPYVGFVITLGACFRLANFNIDTRQTDSFIGLPTPGNALFILSIPLVVLEQDFGWIASFLTQPWVLILISLLSAYVMNAEIPLFSLKIKNFSMQKHALPLGFMVGSAILLVLMGYLGVIIVILAYILSSLFTQLKVKN